MRFIKAVYTEVRKNISQKKYADLINAKDVYRKKMAENAYAFNTQLSYYTVKPIYLLSAYLFYKIGFSLIDSTFLPSLISFFLINIISFFWISKLYNTIKSQINNVDTYMHHYITIGFKI